MATDDASDTELDATEDEEYSIESTPESDSLGDEIPPVGSDRDQHEQERMLSRLRTEYNDNNNTGMTRTRILYVLARLKEEIDDYSATLDQYNQNSKTLIRLAKGHAKAAGLLDVRKSDEDDNAWTFSFQVCSEPEASHGFCAY